MKIFCDTSVLVAASVDNHPHHPEADAVLNRIYAGEDSGHASAHTLAETFSVLSRMPSQPKLDSQVALKILEDLIPHFTFVPLAVDDYLRSIRELTALKLGGGVFMSFCICTRLEKPGWIVVILSTQSNGSKR